MPTRVPHWTHRESWAAAIVIVAVAARLALVWSGWAKGDLVADDAYYYLLIAENIADSGASSFDGRTLTNGYHPLWMATLVALFELAPLGPLSLSIVLTLAIALDCLTGVLLYHRLRTWTSTTRARAAAVLWFAFPIPFLLGIRGTEAPLSAATLLLLVWALTRRETVTSIRWAVAAGAMLGLAGLARTDNLVVAPAATAAALLVLRCRTRCWIGIGAGSALVVAPWLVWSLLRFGSIVQQSGLVKFGSGRMFGTLPAFDATALGTAKAAIAAVGAPWIVPTAFVMGEEGNLGMITAAATAVTAIAFALSARRPDGSGGCRDARGRRAAVWFASVYLGLHTILYGGLMHFYMNWYGHVPFLMLLVLWSAGDFTRVSRRRRSRFHPTSRIARIARSRSAGTHRNGIAVVLFAAVLVAGYIRFATTVPSGPAIPSERWDGPIATALERYPGATLGAFNAGAAGFVARTHGARVVNLDGLVNREAYTALRSGEYAGYILRTADILLESPHLASMHLQPDEVDIVARRYLRDAEQPLWVRRDLLPQIAAREAEASAPATNPQWPAMHTVARGERGEQ